MSTITIYPQPRPRIPCADGCSVSVQGTAAACCRPRRNTGPYELVEVGYPRDADGRLLPMPDHWEQWRQLEADTHHFAHSTNPVLAPPSLPVVWTFVPIEHVIDWVNEHGGIEGVGPVHGLAAQFAMGLVP